MFSYPFAATGADFTGPSSLVQTFVTGSGNGAQRCASLSAVTDNLIEGDEEFDLMLVLVAPGGSLNLENSATSIIIKDVDSK